MDRQFAQLKLRHSQVGQFRPDNSEYIKIPLTPVQLKNGDDVTYISTGITAGNYTYSNDVWNKDCIHAFNETILVQT